MAALKDTQILNKNKFSDNIDKITNRKNFANQFKICSRCNLESPSTNRICKSCKGKLIKPKIADGESATEKKAVNPYSHFKSKPIPNNISMIVGEPEMLNPNSFENLATILRPLGWHANIEQYSNDDNAQKRKWLFIEIDGDILSPVLKLIYNVHKCSKCIKSIYGIENFDDHLCVEAYSLAPEYEFDWLIPQSGLSHFEMNVGKSFMSLCWDVL